MYTVGEMARTPGKRGNRWHPEDCLQIDMIRPLWEGGLSTRQIANRLGYAKSLVHKLCTKFGLVRSQRDAAILRQSSKSNHWRSARAAARKIMERHLGRRLKPYEHVHHKDEDYTNRDLKNLEVLISEKHYDLHWPDRHIPYEQRPSRKQYKKEYRKRVAKTKRMRGVSSK